MSKNKQEQALYLANVLGNLSVVGLGLAFFNEQWSELIPALIALVIGLLIIRKSA